MTGFVQHVEDYLRLRRSLGYKLDDHARLLRRFAAHLDAIGAECVTVELALVLGARAEGAARERGAVDAAAGRAGLRAVHGRDRPADGDPAHRADPVSPTAAAAVHLQRRRDPGVDGAGTGRDSPGVVRRDLRDADRAARRDRHADQRGDQARPHRHRLGRGRAARPRVEVQQVALRTPARDGPGCARALRAPARRALPASARRELLRVAAPSTTRHGRSPGHIPTSLPERRGRRRRSVSAEVARPQAHEGRAGRCWAGIATASTSSRGCRPSPRIWGIATPSYTYYYLSAAPELLACAAGLLDTAQEAQS